VDVVMVNELSIRLEQVQCGTCGVIHAVPERLLTELRKSGGFYFCPVGHQWGWQETELDRVRKKLDAQIREATAQAARAQRAERSDASARKEIARLAKRASAGLCSCCNRTFKNLARHMQTKHKKATP